MNFTATRPALGPVFDRLKAAIHYICEKASDTKSDALDPVKLNKVLWYADAHSYMTTGRAITGATFIKKPFGPVARQHSAALEQLVQDGSILPGKSSGSRGWFETHFDVISEADKSPFSDKELEILDTVIRHVCLNSTSMGISQRSHGEIWQCAEDGEELPLYTVFAESVGRVTAEQMARASVGIA